MSVIPYVENPPWADGSGGGTPISAAKLNTLEQGVTDAHLKPAVSVYHNASQAITNNTETALLFNTEQYDTVGGASSTMHDTATNTSRLTCRHAGKYHVSAFLQFPANGTGHRQLFFRVNATAGQYLGFVRIVANASVAGNLHSNVTIDLAVNDYVEAFVLQDSGGSLSVLAGTALFPSLCQFQMHRVA